MFSSICFNWLFSFNSEITSMHGKMRCKHYILYHTWHSRWIAEPYTTYLTFHSSLHFFELSLPDLYYWFDRHSPRIIFKGENANVIISHFILIAGLKHEIINCNTSNLIRSIHFLVLPFYGIISFSKSSPSLQSRLKTPTMWSCSINVDSAAWSRMSKRCIYPVLRTSQFLKRERRLKIRSWVLPMPMGMWLFGTCKSSAA